MPYIYFDINYLRLNVKKLWFKPWLSYLFSFLFLYILFIYFKCEISNYKISWEKIENHTVREFETLNKKLWRAINYIVGRIYFVFFDSITTHFLRSFLEGAYYMSFYADFTTSSFKILSTCTTLFRVSLMMISFLVLYIANKWFLQCHLIFM
jgi:hypothetical protein